MQTTENKMGTLPIKKLIWQLSLPGIIAQVINILYNMVDRMYVGHMPEVGVTALTGLGVSAPLLLIVSAFSGFVGGGGAPLAAIELGRRREDEAESYLGVSVALLLVLSVVLTIVFLLIKGPLLYFFGASDSTFAYADAYTSIYLIGTVFVMLALGLNLFISCQGQARTAMFTVVIGAVCNIVLDPIFIFGFRMGVRGAALATIISQALSAAFVVRFLLSEKSHIRIRRELIRFELPKIKKIMSLGVSTFVMTATESAVVIVFNNGLRHYGSDLYVGAMTIMQSVIQLISLPVMGFTSGVQPLISYSYGAKRYDRLNETLRRSITLTLTACLSYYVLVLIAPGAFARIFTPEAELIGLVKEYLPVFMIGMSIFAIQSCAQMLFVGTGQAKKSLFLALLRKVVLLIPLAITLPRAVGVKGIIWAEPIADVSSVTCSAILLIHYFIKLKKVERGELKEL